MLLYAFANPTPKRFCSCFGAKGEGGAVVARSDPAEMKLINQTHRFISVFCRSDRFALGAGVKSVMMKEASEDESSSSRR